MPRQRVDRGEPVVVASRRSAPVWTSRATARRGSRSGTRRAPAFHRGGIAVPKHERARHRPFAGFRGALEYERVRRIEADGAQQLPRGPPVSGSSHDTRDSASTRKPNRFGGSHALHQGRRSRRSWRTPPLMPPRLREMRTTAPDHSSRISPKPFSFQTSIALMRWRAKLSTSRPEPRPSKPSSSSAAWRRAGRARLRLATPCGSWRRTPARARVRSRRRRVAIPAARRRPARDRRGSHRASRRRSASPAAMHRQRIGERGRTGVDGAPRLPERLVGLQHHRELREVEPPDMHQGAGARLGRDRSHAPWRRRPRARSRAERGRQIEGRRSRHKAFLRM